MVPRSINFPILTSTGKEAKWCPKGVSFSSDVKAPISCNRVFDAFIDSAVGGSISCDNTEWSLCVENISKIFILGKKYCSAKENYQSSAIWCMQRSTELWRVQKCRYTISIHKILWNTFYIHMRQEIFGSGWETFLTHWTIRRREGIAQSHLQTSVIIANLNKNSFSFPVELIS